MDNYCIIMINIFIFIYKIIMMNFHYSLIYIE